MISIETQVDKKKIFNMNYCELNILLNTTINYAQWNIVIPLLYYRMGMEN